MAAPRYFFTLGSSPQWRRSHIVVPKQPSSSHFVQHLPQHHKGEAAPSQLVVKESAADRHFATIISLRYATHAASYADADARRSTQRTQLQSQRVAPHPETLKPGKAKARATGDRGET